MPENVWQHFVPQVYLRPFSATSKDELWLFDGQSIGCKSVKSQCAEEYFYSSSDPAFFQTMEDTYGRILDKRIQRGKTLTAKDRLGLILMMFDLHCRNRAYTNLTGEKNVDSYNALIHCLHILLGENGAPLSSEQLLQHLRNTWRVRLLETSCEPGLITSDNPALWFTFDETEDKQRLHFMLLPITPRCCAVAWDMRFVRVNGSDLTKDDQTRLSFGQIQHCTRFVYCSSKPSLDELPDARIAWKERERPAGQVRANSCDFNFLGLKGDTGFSFLTSI